MLPGICGIGILIVVAVMMIAATVHFSLDELNDTDFEGDARHRSAYDHYTDHSIREKRTFFSVMTVTAALLLSTTISMAFTLAEVP